MTNLLLGCCGFAYADWRGSFYAEDAAPTDYLSRYAGAFAAVEIDSTFYGPPSETTVESWAAKTPPRFRFALKVPQVVTHEKVLRGAESDFDAFVSVTERLGEKRGVLLLQFPRFSRAAFGDAGEFRERLDGFLSGVDRDLRVAVEVRNRGWLDEAMLDLLRDHGAGVAITDQVVDPNGAAAGRYVTSDFAYVRLLGERARIEAVTKTWDKVVIDRGAELGRWARFLSELSRALPDGPVWVLLNNHFAGHAPASARTLAALLDAWRE